MGSTGTPGIWEGPPSPPKKIIKHDKPILGTMELGFRVGFPFFPPPRRFPDPGRRLLPRGPRGAEPPVAQNRPARRLGAASARASNAWFWWGQSFRCLKRASLKKNRIWALYGGFLFARQNTAPKPVRNWCFFQSLYLSGWLVSSRKGDPYFET